jgi:anti-anti-sigma factor
MPDRPSPCDPLNVSVRITPGEVIVQPTGELDISTTPQLEQALEKAGRRGLARVVLDLSELSFMDASGLRTILEVSGRLGGRLVVRDAQPQVLRIFEIAGAGDEIVFEGEAPSPRSGDAEANVEYVRRRWDAFRTDGSAALAALAPDDVD